MSQTAVAKKTTTSSTTSSGLNTPASDVLDDKTLTDPLKAKEAEINADGALTWEAALGEKIGGSAWDALKDELTPDKLLGHANGALDDAFDKLMSWLDGKAPDAIDFEKISGELEKVLGPKIDEAAAKLIGGEDGLALKIKQFAADNPWLLASAAVAGAVGYLLSNPDLPEMKPIKTKLAGHPLVIDAKVKGKLFDLGKISDLTIDKLGAKYTWGSGSASADYSQSTTDAGTTRAANAQLKQKLGDNGSVEAKGNWQSGPDGTKLAGSGSLAYKAFEASGSHSSDTTGTAPASATKASAAYKGDALKASANYASSTSGGSQSTAFDAKAAYEGKHLKGNASYESTSKDGVGNSLLKAGASYENGGLQASSSFKQATGPSGTTTDFFGKAAYEKGGFQASGQHKHTTGPSGSTHDFLAKAAYENGGFKASGEYNRVSGPSGTTDAWSGNASLTGDDSKLSLFGNKNADGTQKYGLSGNHTFDGGGTLSGNALYNVDGGTRTFDSSLSFEKDNFAASAFYKNQNGPDRSIQSAGGQMSYSSGNFTGSLKGMGSSDGTRELTGSAAYKGTGSPFSGKLDLSHLSGPSQPSTTSLNAGMEYKKGNFSAFGGLGAQKTGDSKWDPAAKIGLKWSF